MTDKPIGQHWRDGAIYFATGRSEEESLEYIRSMPKAVLAILREALEDTGPFKADKVPQEAPEASALADQEAAPFIATIVAAARAGETEAAVGVALAGLILNGQRGVRAEIAGLRGEIAEIRDGVAQLRERMAHLEGLLEGLREAITVRASAS